MLCVMYVMSAFVMRFIEVFFFSCVFYRLSWCERRIRKLSVVMDDDVVAAAANGLFCVHAHYSHLILFDWFRFCTSTLTLNSLSLSLCQPNWHILYTHYFQFNSLFGFLLFNDLLLMFFFCFFIVFLFAYNDCVAFPSRSHSLCMCSCVLTSFNDSSVKICFSGVLLWFNFLSLSLSISLVSVKFVVV